MPMELKGSSSFGAATSYAADSRDMDLRRQRSLSDQGREDKRERERTQPSPRSPFSRPRIALIAEWV